MAANCCNHTPEYQLRDQRYRGVLWAVLAINTAMFLIEIAAGSHLLTGRCTGFPRRRRELQISTLSENARRQEYGKRSTPMEASAWKAPLRSPRDRFDPERAAL